MTIFNAEHHFNIVATLFRMAAMFQHCYAVLRKKTLKAVWFIATEIRIKTPSIPFLVWVNIMQEQVVHKKVAEILALEHLFSKLLDTFLVTYFFLY